MGCLPLLMTPSRQRSIKAQRVHSMLIGIIADAIAEQRPCSVWQPLSLWPSLALMGPSRRVQTARSGILPCHMARCGSGTTHGPHMSPAHADLQQSKRPHVLAPLMLKTKA